MNGPHQDQPVESGGASLEEATGAIILLHGRGATARSILDLAREFDRSDLAYLAPQAARRTWYPNSFMAPVEQNEPGRSSGLSRIGALIDSIQAEDIPHDRIVLIGFSQGACLASEFVARNPRRYGGLAALSGGLIGDTIDPDEYKGDLEETPVFLGCSDRDPHIPAERVHKTADIFEHLNAKVTKKLYEGMGHGVNQDELDHINELLERI